MSTVSMRRALAATTFLVLALAAPAGAAVSFDSSSIVLPDGLRALTVRELDGDGQLDVAVVQDEAVRVLRGDGTGALQPGPSATIPTNAGIGIVSADLDANNRLPDLALTLFGGDVGVLASAGGGEYAPIQTHATGLGAILDDIAVSRAAGWSSDLVVSSRLDNGFVLMQGGRVPAFPGKVDVPGGPGAVAVDDFDRDGDDDVAVTTAAGDVAVLSRTGSFAEYAAPVRYPTGDVPVDVVSSDFDGDGNADLAVANLHGSTVTVLQGLGDGRFDLAHQLTVPAPAALATGHFDGDDDIDLAVVGGQELRVLTGGPGAGFATAATYPVTPNASSVAVGDLDRDGGDDILLGDPHERLLRVFLARGAVSADPPRVDFPATPVGTATARRDVTVTNIGGGTLRVSGVTVAGGDGDQFAIAGETCTDAPLSSNATCVVSVRFRPITEGAAASNIRIAGNLAAGPALVPLSGTGGTPPAGRLSVSPSSMSFGEVVVGRTSGARRVVATNTGDGPLELRSAQIDGTNARDFATVRDECSGRTLAPGASCTTDVTFRPSARGSRSGSLRLAHSASAEAARVALSGRGCGLIVAGVCL